ncbi:hypothetical protein BGX38DRAFT_669584 [Terfezia claveryi]|nr:hypothetical protein BGX38DRAFT_669584 [Terfezia claveryi]
MPPRLVALPLARGMPPTTTATTTVYSGEVIPNQAFSKDLHVKPVLGYYIFFTAESLDDDLKGKVESETPKKIAMSCLHNVGYLIFSTENEALEALKELKNLKWLSMDDWKREQWKFDCDGKIKRKLAEAKADLLTC